jgi:superfamily II DNA or RNA helicase
MVVYPLTGSGVEVDKKSLSTVEIKAIIKELTVKSTAYNPHGVEAPSFPIYTETPSKLFLPPHWVNEKRPTWKIDNQLQNGKKVKLKFSGTLRESQKIIADKAEAGLKKIGGGIITIPCGGGKTILAIEQICRANVKTLVIVHKKFLVNQWRKRLSQFSNARIGIMQGKILDVENKDVVIGMLKSVATKEYDPAIFREFGMVVIDECHHMGAPIYCRALPRIMCSRMLGLSATPKRKDGLSKVFHWWMGPTLHYEPMRENSRVKVRKWLFSSKHETFKQYWTWVPKSRRKGPNYTKILAALVELKERNKFIVDRIVECFKTRGAKILVLSSRLVHLKKLKKMLRIRLAAESAKLIEAERMFRADGFDDLADECAMLNCPMVRKSAYYVGGMSEMELEKSEMADIIFATDQMAEEGLDIPGLNKLFLTSPKKDVVQSVGRILRVMDYEEGCEPEVFDIEDQLSTCMNQGGKRDAFYHKCKYQINTYTYNDGVIAEKGVKAAAFNLDELQFADDD